MFTESFPFFHMKIFATVIAMRCIDFNHLSTYIASLYEPTHHHERTTEHRQPHLLLSLSFFVSRNLHLLVYSSEIGSLVTRMARERPLNS